MKGKTKAIPIRRTKEINKDSKTKIMKTRGNIKVKDSTRLATRMSNRKDSKVTEVTKGTEATKAMEIIKDTEKINDSSKDKKK